MSDEYKIDPGGFVSLIQDQRGGLLEQDLDKALKRVSNLLRVRGGTGKVTLTFTIKDVVEYDGAVGVSDDIKVVEPKVKNVPELRFQDKTGGLVLDRPDQKGLFEEPKPSSEKPEPLKTSTAQVTPLK